MYRTIKIKLLKKFVNCFYRSSITFPALMFDGRQITPNITIKSFYARLNLIFKDLISDRTFIIKIILIPHL